MATVLSFLSGRQITDDDGAPQSGAKLFHYQAGTTTNLTVYSNQAGTTAHAQPVVCDAGGFVPLVYIDTTSDWKVLITTSAGVTLHTYDNLPKAPVTTSAANFAAPLLTFNQKTSANSPVTLVAADAGQAYEADTTSGSITFNLPSAASVGNGKGFWFKKTASSNSMIIDASGSETIDDISTVQTISAKDTTIGIFSNGAEWYKVVQSPRVNVQTFTASGTYTPTVGMSYCRVRVQAAGGGGGGADGAGSSSQGVAGGGGGGGEYAEGFFTAAQISTSQAVTIGAVGAAGTNAGGDGGTGANSSLGSLLTAVGGTGGTGTGSDSAVNTIRAGGGGGTGGTGGHLRIAGTRGGDGLSRIFTVNSLSWGGEGGGSHFSGTRGTQNGLEANTAGGGGNNYGQGGGGATAINNTGAAGAAGGAAILIVEEFIC